MDSEWATQCQTAARPGLDIVTAVVAIYAALVATGAFVVNLLNWIRAWQTRVEVIVQRMDSVAFGSSEREPVVLFELVNRSAHPVKVTTLSLAPVRKGGEHLLFLRPFPLTSPLPIELPPHDATDLWIEPDEIAKADPDPSYRTRAWVRTSDRGNFKSKRFRVRTLLEDPPQSPEDSPGEGENSDAGTSAG